MSNNPSQPHDPQVTYMRWFILIVLAIGFLSSIVACIILKNPVPSFLTIIMYRAISWLFPSRQPSKFSLILQILLDKQHNKRRVP